MRTRLHSPRSFGPPTTRLGVTARGSVRGGFTLIEVVVAMAIAVTFLTGVYMSFIDVVRMADRAEARVEALRSSRAALSIMKDELKAIGRSGAEFLLIGVTNSAGFGDGIDNDLDGAIDEETLDGRDNDGDWTAANDLHMQIGTADPVFERYLFTNAGPYGTRLLGRADDLGDTKVDEDVVFGRDSILFRVFPSTTATNIQSRTIAYIVDTFDGRPNVLIRQVRTEFTDQPAQITTAPLAFGVLGLDILYWDPNAITIFTTLREGRPYWVEQWNSFLVPTFDPPRLPLPASIFVRVTVYADERPIGLYTDGDEVKTLFLQTIVNVEDTIGDALYPRPLL